MELMAGLVLPNAGRIIRKARVSFPVGHQGGFTPDLSVRNNVAHVARLHDADVATVVDFVAAVSQLGKAFDRPIDELPAASRRSLSSIVAFSIPFDVYLLRDDVVRLAKRNNKAVYALFEARAKTSGMIISSQNFAFVRKICDMGLVLLGGQARLFKNIERAIAFAKKSGVRKPNKQKGKAKKKQKGKVGKKKRKQPEDLEEFY
jgi:capsular polysaccharide transport system ATP-binding protein